MGDEEIKALRYSQSVAHAKVNKENHAYRSTLASAEAVTCSLGLLWFKKSEYECRAKF